MKVGLFYNSISNPKKFSNKTALMDNFCQGVLACGDEPIEYHSNHLPTDMLDAGFVLGYTLSDNFRGKIIDYMRALDIPQIYVDSNMLHYAKPEHEWHRYSVNSVYPDTGIYFFDQPDPDKWQVYSQWHNVTIKPWRETGSHILILCQRPMGWNMLGNDQMSWLDDTITKIRRYSNRPICVRMHPRDGKRFDQIQQIKEKFYDNVAESTHADIRDDLANCWCAVGYNSTPNVVAAIEGIPVYVEDPVHSWAKDIAFADLDMIENPTMPDRTEWISKIANIHWSNNEVISGKLWHSIRKYISSAHA